ncbi:hypothetical protein [Burkholderia perseverans]|uniref:hypothetical protein n=1 Tax=Burkholderia perseverans TaxID=2615214 RepID=UPI001FED7D71|nr:hypothetical protein [Burkholderia perseverans]
MRSPRHARAHAALAAGLAAALLAAASAADAQSIEDKLRTQLRSTTQELHQLQDGQAQLTADKAAAEQARDKALADLKEAQAQLAAAKGESSGEAAAKRSLAEERAAHAQDTQALAKLKSSYEALQASAHTNETQRTKLQADITSRDTQLQTCQAQNTDLYRVGHEILDAYEHVGFGTLMSSRQPFAESARVKYDEIGQRYGDALYAGKYDPARRPAAASAPAAASGAK